MRQFSLKQLFFGIAIFGLLIASLRYAGPRNARALFYVVVMLLTFSVPLAYYAREPRRAFWFGFAIFGWIMLCLTQFHVLTATPQGGTPPAIWGFHPLSKEHFPTRVATRGVYGLVRPVLVIPTPPIPNPILSPRVARRSVVIDQKSNMTQYADGTLVTIGPGPFYIVEDDFLAVADSWWILLAAVTGGLLTDWIARRNAPPVTT